MYPQKEIHSILDKHVKNFVQYTGECEFQNDFRSKDKDIPWGIATIHQPTLVGIHKKV